MVRSGFPIYEVKKNEVLKLFDWTSSEYNDLMRTRPNKKKAFNHPYFTPIFQAPQGQGHKFKLTFHDLMLLSILMDFQRSKFDRSIGRFLRDCIIASKEEDIWNPSHLNEDTTSWRFQIHINPGGQQVVLLNKIVSLRNNIIASKALVQTHDGLESSHISNINEFVKSTDFQSELMLIINLNKIHNKVMGVLKKI